MCFPSQMLKGEVGMGTLSLPSIITHKIWIKCHTGNLYSFDPSILFRTFTVRDNARVLKHFDLLGVLS